MNAKRFIIIAIVGISLAALTFGSDAQAGWRRYPGQTKADRWAAQHPVPWHAPYYHTQWGTPLALVVPPQATSQAHWSWGVSGSRLTPIYPQYGLSFPGGLKAAGGQGLYGTPAWPSDTSQFGVYYIRGPW